MNIKNFIDHPAVRDWLQTLYDCPPGRARHGYGLVDAWWSGYRCRHALCIGAVGCVLEYHRACSSVHAALIEMVDLQLVVPVGRSHPLEGHTHTVEGFVPLKCKAGEKWLEGFAPTYTYGFEPGDRLCEYLDEWVDGVWKGAST
jgi:hypothetical protein